MLELLELLELAKSQRIPDYFKKAGYLLLANPAFSLSI
jgi:hypothetical protein